MFAVDTYLLQTVDVSKSRKVELHLCMQWFMQVHVVCITTRWLQVPNCSFCFLLLHKLQPSCLWTRSFLTVQRHESWHDWVKAVLDWAPITVLACISSIVETSCSAGKCPINSQRAGRSGQGQQYSNSSALPRSQVLGVHAARPQGLILTGGHDALTFSIPRSLNILARLVLSFQVLHYVFSGESTKSSQTFKLHTDVCRTWHVKQT